MRFTKYHALGNDYLVLDDAPPLEPALIRRICDRHFGIGSDGILLPQLADTSIGVRIFNPDGSEAEKSGNGLRIFARWLWDNRHVGDAPFAVQTRGGTVRCTVQQNGAMVDVAMGRVSFWSADIPVAGPPREVLEESLSVGDRELVVSAATIGNPHCVVICPEATPHLARELGPILETHPLFPQHTNVQFVRIIDQHSVQIEIWERGAGYTLASGSSSCATAAVCHRLGRCASAVQVHMPGGTLAISIAPDWNVQMIGPVRHVATGVLAEDIGVRE